MVNALMIGAGEYTTGCVFTASGAAPDKPAGVVGICFVDMRRRGKLNRLVLADACGTKLPIVRQTMALKIGEAYKDMDVTMETFPADNVEFDPEAYKLAIASMEKGDVVTIFTPDDTHFDIAMACIEAGLHVLIAKPAVKSLRQHRQLAEAAREHGVLVAVEYHKRFDPIYTDAVDRIRTLGGFSFFTSTMTQHKAQLDTFRGWAGKSSDISYYLNSHHIDIHAWACLSFARPIRVTAMASTGIADHRLDRHGIEDTITLMVQWENRADKTLGTAIYMSSWAAPKADCHTQQYFHYMGHKGEVRADQCHRGYNWSTDENGFANLNPLYMKYTPNATGHFAGQNGYGYVSLERFVEAAEAVNCGSLTPDAATRQGVLATIDSTLVVTAILEAGRISLDLSGSAIEIAYDEAGIEPIELKIQE